MFILPNIRVPFEESAHRASSHSFFPPGQGLYQPPLYRIIPHFAHKTSELMCVKLSDHITNFRYLDVVVVDDTQRFHVAENLYNAECANCHTHMQCACIVDVPFSLT